MKVFEFWISAKDEYLLLSAKAQQIPIQFETSYLCEAGFSAFTVKEIKYGAKISVEQEISLAVCRLITRFEKSQNRGKYRISNCG